MYIVNTTSATESVWQVSVSSSGVYLCPLGEAASLGTAISRPRSALLAFTPHNVSRADTLPGAAAWNSTDKLCWPRSGSFVPWTLRLLHLVQILPCFCVCAEGNPARGPRYPPRVLSGPEVSDSSSLPFACSDFYQDISHLIAPKLLY